MVGKLDKRVDKNRQNWKNIDFRTIDKANAKKIQKECTEPENAQSMFSERDNNSILKEIYITPILTIKILSQFLPL